MAKTKLTSMIMSIKNSMNVIMTINGTGPQQTPIGGGPVLSNITVPNVWELGARILEWLVITPYLVGLAMALVRIHRGETVTWSDSWSAFRNGNYGRIVLVQLCWLAVAQQMTARLRSRAEGPDRG